MVNICQGNICPGDICQYQKYLSSNCPDFDETLKIGSLEHLEQIPTVMVTFVDATCYICPGDICPYQEYLSSY